MVEDQILTGGPDQCDWEMFDFIDLGCSRGGSIGFCQKRFNARRGVGVDLSAEKVHEARVAGYDAMVFDARDIPAIAGVRFVSMLDFLEHLPSLETVEQVIRVAARAATDFLFIRHPSFEGEHYLESLGLRQYWWHWSGHTAHIRISDYCRIFEACGLTMYFIRYRDPITDSSHHTILNSNAPINQGEFNADVHPPKPFIEFKEPLWRAQDIFVALRPFSDSEWKEIVQDSRGSGARLHS